MKTGCTCGDDSHHGTDQVLINGKMRVFESGATRDGDDEKIQYRGFLSYAAIRKFCDYMHRHRIQADGELRAADNWKRGIPVTAYLDSLDRHSHQFFEKVEEGTIDQEILCAMWFNIQGLLFELGREGHLDEIIKEEMSQEQEEAE